jgi:hypothetical protein
MLSYQTREYILSGKAIYEYCLFASPYYFTPLSENREKNAMGIPRGNLKRFMTSCKLNTNPFKHLKRLWLYLSAKLIKLGSEKCYFPDILKIGTDKGTWHQKRKKMKKKKAINHKQNEPKYILVEDQLSPFVSCFCQLISM